MNVITVKEYLLQLQRDLCAEFEKIDTRAKFFHDPWQKAPGEKIAGHGITCVLKNGKVFEKAGVNFSHVSGQSLPISGQSSARAEYANQPFEALGVSVVIHPDNPYIPTSHFNIRFFMTQKADGTPHWWFGGGFDLTPYYGFVEDCVHWHQTAKDACSPFGMDVYPQLKAWCDKYFYLKHRSEARGIGGLFFDDWNPWEWDKCFEFFKSIGNSYKVAYLPIVEKRKSMPFGEREKAFQKMRRGRYVEFNLLYDRGTLFGLQSGGRTESILMSLPPEVSWEYAYQAKENSPEALLVSDFLTPQEWV